MKHYFVTREASMNLTTGLLKAYGVPENDAWIVADHLTKAEMRGLASHGLQRLSYYIPKLRAGGIKANPHPKILRDNGASIQYDADSALGMVTGVSAMKLCVERAKKYGVSCVNVLNANHYGYLAYYADMALEENMIALCMCVTKANTAPYGSNVSALGSNPLCLAVPSSENPVVYDGATSIVAQGKLSVAKLENKPIPDNWAFDPDGKPTISPSEAINGALRTMGGYKGSGISMLISLICCGLGDMPFEIDEENVLRYNDVSLGQGLDELFMALDISSFTDAERFKERIGDYSNRIKLLRKDEDAGGIFLPGEKERIKVERATESGGFTISESLRDKLAYLVNEARVASDIDDWKSV